MVHLDPAAPTQWPRRQPLAPPRAPNQSAHQWLLGGSRDLARSLRSVD